MKKSLFAVLLALCLLLCACQSGGPYTVTFAANCDGLEAPADLVLEKSGKIAAPEGLSRNGYMLLGWYTDAAMTAPWDFEKDKVQSDLTLYALWDVDTADEIKTSANDKDFSSLRTPGSQENAYEYSSYFLPAMDGVSQPYVGDPMPYYEDGVYYIYYLKDGGDSYNHSIYLATTTDFVTYNEVDTPVLEASRSGGQDAWVGTGSVVKVDGTYYLFYTGHTGASNAEFKEKIMVAKGSDPYTFEKVEGWYIDPPADLRQKNDFRDPQCYYDPQTGLITMTITASQDGTARILKYTVSKDLTQSHYDGVIFTNPVGKFWNLECTDTFRMGNTWYVTYSAQDDTLWYASSDSRYGPYSEPVRLEGKLFYAAKHVEDGENSYMVGWARRSESASSTQDVAAWGGNLVVQKIMQKENGELYLAPVDAVLDQFGTRRALAMDSAHQVLQAGSRYIYADAFTCYESFAITGEFRFDGEGSFGLAFDFNGKEEKYKMISLNPADGLLQLSFNEGSTLITEKEVALEAGRDYTFTYIQEGSVGVFYIDGEAALTVRIYGASGKTIRLFAENNTVTFTSLRQYTK